MKKQGPDLKILLNTMKDGMTMKNNIFLLNIAKEVLSDI